MFRRRSASISRLPRLRRQSSRVRTTLLAFGLALALLFSAEAAEVLPPKPAAYCNDYAGVASPQTVRQLDAELRQFERDTSNQIVVAVFPKLASASSVQDFTHRIAEAWKVGQAGRDNGAVLFVFIAERKVFIQVGYGLEGALPDITAKRIVENEITPAFRAGDYDAGLRDGVAAMIAATRGEYRGTGRVRSDTSAIEPWEALLVFLLLLIFVTMFVRGLRRGVEYSPRGRRDLWPDVAPGGGGAWTGGGGWSGGGGGGGGDFSGGGGGFGGGGAGGDW